MSGKKIMLIVFMIVLVFAIFNIIKFISSVGKLGFSTEDKIRVALIPCIIIAVICFVMFKKIKNAK